MQRESFLRPITPIRTSDPAAAQPVLSLLEHCLDESQADAAYLYRTAELAGAVELIGRAGVASSQASAREADRAFPDQRLILAESASSDSRLFLFPEIGLDRMESVALTPVDASPGRAALVIGRRQPLPFDALHIAIFEAVALALTAVLQNLQQAEELSQLRAELQRTREKLAGRKAIERAKGIIQARDACTEDEAYGHLRRLSRTTREPMSEIARRVIERSGAAAVERKQLLA